MTEQKRAAFDAELNAPTQVEIDAALAALPGEDMNTPPSWWGDGSNPGWPTAPGRR